MAQAKGVLPSKADDRDVLYKNERTCGYFIAARLRSELTAGQIQDALPALDEAVNALVARGEPTGEHSKGEKYASVAVGLAASFFDRSANAGIPLERPAGFTDAAAPPTPRFAGTTELPADMMFYVASVMEHRVEVFMRALASLGIEVVGLERGYQRVDESEPFGYRDGVRNVRSRDRTDVVYVHDESQPDEPSWAVGGTYMVTMKIRQNLAAFASLADDAARDNTIGRKSNGTRLDLADGFDPHDEAPDVPMALPANSHVRKAGPRGTHDDTEIFRRGMPFTEFADGAVQVGLHFCSFQATPNQFDTVFNDWMLN